MPKISVIVPVYKVEAYLHRCVDSILAQTFTDFELILVDDGSPDNCGKICDEYAEKDSRIVVIHQENGGVSAARNAGIDWAFANSSSEWLSFIDSDDWVHPQYLELLLKAATDQSCDIAICGLFETSDMYLTIIKISCSFRKVHPENFYCYNRANAIVAWGKLINKNLFLNVRFPLKKIHEDEFIIYKILFSCNNLSIIQENLYFYFQNNNSIIHSAWSPNNLAKSFAILESIDYFRRNNFNYALQKAWKEYFSNLACTIGYIDKSNLSPKDKNKYKKLVRNKIKKNLLKNLKEHKIFLHDNYFVYENAYPLILSLIYFLTSLRNKIKTILIGLYEFFLEKRRVVLLHTKYRLHIMNAKKTIKYIKRNKCSMARFGDGEFNAILMKKDCGFQALNHDLSQKLGQVFSLYEQKNLLVCIPYTFNNTSGLNKKGKRFWIEWGKDENNQIKIVNLIRTKTKNYIFGDTEVTRPYIDWKNGRHAGKIYPLLRSLWDDKSILIVEGEQTRLGVGNDLFDNAKDIKRILAPATNAFDYYSDIIDAVIREYKGQLVLLALGPTATILAADLSKYNIQALDVGHIDIEYEWFLRGVKEKVTIPNKWTNESADGKVFTECLDKNYKNQIICVIGE